MFSNPEKQLNDHHTVLSSLREKSEKSCQLAAALMYAIQHNPNMGAPLQTALLASTQLCQERGGSLQNNKISTQTSSTFFNPHFKQARELLAEAAKQDPKTYQSAFQTVTREENKQEALREALGLVMKCPI